MAWLLERFRVSAKVTSGSFLPEGPQVIVTNHHGALDGVILLSLVSRDDVYFVGLYGWSSLGEAVAARLLPVYLSYMPSPFLLERLKNRYYHPLREGVTRFEAARKTSESIRRTSHVLEKGATVIIGPTGGTFFNQSDWKGGLGHIIKRTDRTDISLLFTRVIGAKRRDFMRFLNPYLFRINDKPTVATVEISEPVPVTQFRTPGKSGTQISMEIRDRYLEIYGRLEQ
jgi:1-acyl-sn-glycerol-3-phosphate acyltransferase